MNGGRRRESGEKRREIRNSNYLIAERIEEEKRKREINNEWSRENWEELKKLNGRKCWVIYYHI